MSKFRTAFDLLIPHFVRTPLAPCLAKRYICLPPRNTLPMPNTVFPCTVPVRERERYNPVSFRRVSSRSNGGLSELKSFFLSYNCFYFSFILHRIYPSEICSVTSAHTVLGNYNSSQGTARQGNVVTTAVRCSPEWKARVRPNGEGKNEMASIAMR